MNIIMFNFIDIYSFIPLSGCVGMGPSALFCRGSILLLRRPCSSVVNRGFKYRSSPTKDYKMCICSFSAAHTALRSKSKDWLSRNWDIVHKSSDKCTRGLRVVSVN